MLRLRRDIDRQFQDEFLSQGPDHEVLRRPKESCPDLAVSTSRNLRFSTNRFRREMLGARLARYDSARFADQLAGVFCSLRFRSALIYACNQEWPQHPISQR